MKKKNGFTLIELIAIITLLAVIILVSVPVIINTLSNTEQKEYEDFEKLVTNAAELYIERNRDLYPELNEVYGSVEFNVQELIDEGYLKQDLTSPDNKLISDFRVFISTGADNILQYDIHERKILADLATIFPEKNVDEINPCANTGTCELGTPFAIQVNDNEKYKFYVINDDGENVTLIMSGNLGGNVAWIDQTDFESEGGTDWNVINPDMNKYGPITALKNLKARTAGWTNISAYDYELVYGPVFSYDEHFNATSVDDRYSGTYVRNVRARLPKLSDVVNDSIGCVVNEKSTCPPWVYEGIDAVGDNASSGYWLSNAYAENPLLTYIITREGTLYGGTVNTTVGYPDYFGVRPVIQISRY